MTLLLKKILKKSAGRDSKGQVSIRHQGGGHKQFLRIVDFKRNKIDIEGKVESFEYDPNRFVRLAVVIYRDGERRYILAPEGLKIGDKVISAASGDMNPGNVFPLSAISIGTPIHNLEITPGKGGQLVRGAGTMAVILSKDEKHAHVRLPSGEIRLFDLKCMAGIGQLGNIAHKLEKMSKAGDSRHRGIRPTVRGVAQNPRSHPHGGGEGRSGIGMPGPKTPWGKPALGKRTRNKSKYSNSLIIKRRKSS